MNKPFYKANKRNWYHPSVVKLMDEAGNKGSPEEIIIRKAQEYVQRGMNSGWQGPPFDPSMLASIFGIRQTHVEGIEAEAQIVPINKNQFELQFRKDVVDTRLNFTLCHEIAHTFFPDCGKMIHFRNTHRKSFDPEKEVEILCDIGAAQMLLPSPFFEKDLINVGLSLKSASSLSEKYKASREAIIRRMPSTNLESCAVVYLGIGFNKKELESINNPLLPFEDSEIVKPKPRLRIRRVHASTKFKIFLPGNKSIPDDSIIYSLLRGEEYVEAKESWDIVGFHIRDIEAIRLYNNQKDLKKSGILVLVH